MAHLIDKDALVAEVQRLQDLTMDENKNFYSEAAEGEYNALCNIEHFIDFLQEESEPQFKVGDIIRSKIWESAVHKIVSMDDSAYYFENGGMVRFDDQEQWELVEEPVNEDLEKAAEEAAVVAFFVSPQWTKTGERLFKAGALWQKQQDSKLPKIWDRETLDEYAYQVAYDLSNDWLIENPTWDDVETAVKLGAKWQENEDQSTIELAEDHAMLAGMEKMKEQMMKNIWKPADGDDLPVIDREVIALLNSGKVVFAHRPYKGKYIGKNLTTGNIETFENKTYDKGGWNIPDVKWWLDCGWPKQKEE